MVERNLRARFGIGFVQVDPELKIGFLDPITIGIEIGDRDRAYEDRLGLGLVDFVVAAVERVRIVRIESLLDVVVIIVVLDREEGVVVPRAGADVSRVEENSPVDDCGGARLGEVDVENRVGSLVFDRGQGD